MRATRHYLKTLRALPSHLKRAFLDGDWDVFAGQYFDRFDCSRHVVRAEEIDWKPWWPRWISVDWGFEHPAAVYWHAQGEWEAGTGASVTLEERSAAQDDCEGRARADVATLRGQLRLGQQRQDNAQRKGVVTYREYLTHRTPPRELAREIVARCVAGGDSGSGDSGANLAAVMGGAIEEDASLRSG